jgi:hypothetical protein
MTTVEPGNSSSPALPPFGVNELRLTAREWLATLAIVLVVALECRGFGSAMSRCRPLPTIGSRML